MFSQRRALLSGQLGLRRMSTDLAVVSLQSAKGQTPG